MTPQKVKNMSKTLNTAEEARYKVYDINDQLCRLPYNADLTKFCRNINAMVDELSRLEVYTRRTPRGSRYHIAFNKQLNAVQSAIHQIENLILMHRLMA